MKALASYIMRGPLQAAMFVSATAILSLILSPVIFFSGAGLALVTLRRGVGAGLIVLLSSMAISGLFAYFVSNVPDLLFVVLGLAVILVLVWGLAVALRYTRSLSSTLLAAIAVGFACVLILYAITDPATFWENFNTQLFAPVLDKADEQSKASLVKAISETSPYMTYFYVDSGIIVCVLCLFIGRWWQALLYNPGGFQQEFHNLKFPQTFAVVTAVLGVVSFLASHVSLLAYDLFHVALVVYFLQGLAVAHAIARMKKWNTGWLVGVYILSILFSNLVAFAGYVDTWADFRGKIRRGLIKG